MFCLWRSNRLKYFKTTTRSPSLASVPKVPAGTLQKLPQPARYQIWGVNVNSYWCFAVLRFRLWITVSIKPSLIIGRNNHCCCIFFNWTGQTKISSCKSMVVTYLSPVVRVIHHYSTFSLVVMCIGLFKASNKLTILRRNFSLLCEPLFHITSDLKLAQ